LGRFRGTTGFKRRDACRSNLCVHGLGGEPAPNCVARVIGISVRPTLRAGIGLMVARVNCAPGRIGLLAEQLPRRVAYGLSRASTPQRDRR